MTVPYTEKKVLSIQSHVVHGYVGNKASTFPLQTLGWDVDVLNSVNFSNHTGYGDVAGTTTSGDEIKDMYQGLIDIGMSYNAILTGYIHGAETVKAVGEICIDLKKKNTDTMWLLDPVMGDEGQLYVSEKVISVYQSILESKSVDIITPNQFELELLLNTTITDRQTLKRAFQTMHQKYNVKHIVVSSLSSLDIIQGDYQSSKINEDVFYCGISSIDLDSDVYLFEIPRLKSYFTGVGDLFSALLLDRVSSKKSQMPSSNAQQSNYLLESVNEVLSVMSNVLHLTQKLSYQNLGKFVEGKIGDAKTMKECELRIIECRDLYDSKEHKFIPRKIEY